MRLYLTYVLFMVSVGLLDAIAIYRASSHLGADPVYLGFLSFLWSLFYIVSNVFLGPLGDSYRVRVLSLIASSLMILSMLFIVFSDTLGLIAIGYILHAVASSAGRLAISIDVMENKDPDEWGYVNSILRGLYGIFRGVAIYLSLVKGYQELLAVMVIFIASIYIMIIPQGFFRRAIYRAELMLNKIYGSFLLRGLAISSILEKRPGSLQAIEIMWRGLISSGNPLLTAASASILTMAFELIVTPSPSILVREMGSQGLAVYLYSSPAIVGLAVMIIGMLSSHRDLEAVLRRIFTALLLLSGFALAISHSDNNLGVPLVLPLIMFTISYQLLELDIYNKYSSITAGYDVARYLALREVGGLVGGLLSGYIATLYGYLVSIIAGVILVIISHIIRLTS